MNDRDDQMLRRNDPSAMGGSQTSGSQRLTDDMTVYDVNGEKIGKVIGATTSADYFTLEKGLIFHHDYYVPMSAVSRLDPDGVYLNIAKDDIKNRGWENPPLERRETFGEHVRDTLDPLDPNEPRP
ncbi:MAG TPA: DUF2171 domain-containing protein [Ktedonobacterales bacterium]|jgi:hypothetical protein